MEQNTKEWYQHRIGKFNASEISDLFNCSPKFAKREWYDNDKIADFGETAKKYIFKIAMERLRNFATITPETISMTYGKSGEITVKEIIRKKFKNYMLFDDVGAKVHKIQKNVSASSDGLIIDENAQYFNLEIKCPTNWQNYYSRVFKNFDFQHIDFWQIYTQMFVMNTLQTIYAVAEPVPDIFIDEIKYINIELIKADIDVFEIIEKRVFFAEEEINKILIKLI